MKIEEQIIKGFLVRKITLKDGENTSYLWVKNENLVITINNRLYLTCPDLITVIDQKDLLGIHNSRLSVGKKVIIIGIPHAKIWHGERGHEIFSPKHFQLPFKIKSL